MPIGDPEDPLFRAVEGNRKNRLKLQYLIVLEYSAHVLFNIIFEIIKFVQTNNFHDLSDEKDKI